MKRYLYSFDVCVQHCEITAVQKNFLAIAIVQFSPAEPKLDEAKGVFLIPYGTVVYNISLKFEQMITQASKGSLVVDELFHGL